MACCSGAGTAPLTLSCGLPHRIWWRSLVVLTLLALAVGTVSMLLPAADPAAALALRDPQELPDALPQGPPWVVFELVPLSVDRASLLLGLRTSTLIFTVVHSINLVLISTPPEDLVWALSWWLAL